MNQPKLTHIVHFFFILLIINLLCSCGQTKYYTKKKVGSDQILSGSVQKEILNDPKHFSWYLHEHKTYQPKQAFIDSLKTLAPEIFIVVFAGSWCSDTQRELPRLLKIAETATIPDDNIALFMVDKHKKSPFLNVKVFQVKYLPTMIFYRNGVEIGRIIEAPVKSLEEEIWQLYKPN